MAMALLVSQSAAPNQAAGAVNPKWTWRRIKEVLAAYAMVAPFMAILLTFSVYVLYYGFRMSLRDAQGINDGSFVGLQNYKDLLWASEYLSRDFWLAVKTTFVFMVGCLVTQMPVAFVLAYILNHIPLLRLRAVLRAAFFLPVVINTVIIALLFRMLFNPDQGVINNFLGMLGLPNNIDWMMNSSWVMPLMLIAAFWQWTGYHMVYFLSQLQTIDPSLYEAAKLDGASPRRVLWRITLPHMRPAITFAMVTSAIGALQMFDLVFLLFPNAAYGPGGVAKTLVAFVYDQGFSTQFLTGMASAAGWLTFGIVLIISLIQFKVLGLGKHGEA
jgi:ABC-type sugar transport system permease subunit